MCRIVNGVMCCLASTFIKEHRHGGSIVREHWRNFYKPSRHGHCNRTSRCWKGECRCPCDKCAKVREVAKWRSSGL